MTAARRVLNAIDDALVIAAQHPGLFSRMAAAGCGPVELGYAFEAWQAGITTRWWFCGESITRRERARRRSVGKRQRQARKANR